MESRAHRYTSSGTREPRLNDLNRCTWRTATSPRSDG